LDIVEVELPSAVVDKVSFGLSWLVEIALVAHKLDKIRLEGHDFYHWRWLILPYTGRCHNFLVWLLMRVLRASIIDAVTIEEEHPLVHLKVFDVKLGHQFDDLNAFDRQRVISPSLFNSGIDIEDRDELSKEMGPHFLEGTC